MISLAQTLTPAAVLAVSHHHPHQSRTTSVVQHCKGLNFFCHDTAAKQLQDKHYAIAALVVVAVVIVLVLLVRRARRKARGSRGTRSSSYPYRAR